MFDLQLWDVFVGFIACLILVTLFPKLSHGGVMIINGAKWLYTWIKDKISGSTTTIIAMVAISMSMLLMGFGCPDQAAKEPMVDVKIYRHIESGNLIYCETGELTGDLHEYVGEGQIGESTAVAC